jgi:hypothetical protein
MRQEQVEILTLGDMSLASVASRGIDLQQVFVGSIQAYWTGTPVGDFTIEISNDKVAVGLTDPSEHVVNWTTYTGSTEAAGGGPGNFMWNIANIGVRWVRLKYTKASSTGSVTAMWCGKGV